MLRFISYPGIIFFLLSLFFVPAAGKAQLTYDAAASFALNKVNPQYAGSALQVRRACDNATVNIGFSSCGGLDTAALNTFAGLQNFPLTSLTATATAAYSLRKLNCSYAGPAIRVRSSAVGSPTTDIAFTINGDLDTAALKTFVGANSGYVTAWYDQSGAGRHLLQGTAGSQPLIASSGIVLRQNGRPAIRFVSGAHTLYLNTLMMSDKLTVSVVAKINNAANRYALFDLGSTAGSYPDFVIESNTYSTAGNKWGFYTNNNSLDAAANTSTSLTCISVMAKDTYSAANVVASTTLYVNGTASPLSCRSCVTSTYRSSWPNGFTIGNFNTYPAGLDGFMTEFLVFPSNLSAAERQFLEWSQAQYYSITPGAALGALPGGSLPAAYVATWYDQSGNGRNVTQPTNALQPRMVSNGVVEKQNSIPALYFNGSNNYLSASDAGLPTGDLAISAIVRSNAASYASGNYGSFLHYGTSGNGNAVFATYATDGNLGTNAVSISQYGDGFGVSNSLGASLIYSGGRSGNNYYLLKNGGSASAKTMLTNTTLYGPNGLSMGCNNPSLPGSYLNGYISEVSLYPLHVSATRRILTETNRAAYASIAISNSKYTPPAAGSYNQYVNGIGRESATDTVLGTRNTVGMGFSSGTTAADFLQSNGDYMTCGIICPLGPGTSTANLPATVVQRWGSDWYLNKTDAGITGGSITLFFDFSDYGITGGTVPGTASNYELMYRNTAGGTFTIVSGTTKAVVGDRVVFVLDAGLLTTNFYYTIGTKNASASILPVELLSFKAVGADQRADLSWTTATEKNNDYFTIQKSRNGLDFTTLKTVKSKAPKGNSSARLDYGSTDAEPYEGISYYRLLQTDFNGRTTESPVVYVDFRNRGGAELEVYPNPGNGRFTLRLAKGGAEGLNASVIVLDALGSIIYENLLLPEKDTGTFELVLETMPKGLYVLSATIGGKNYIRKLMIH